MKMDEVHRLTNLYEDNMRLVKELKLENEAMKQKMDLLRSEYYKVDANATEKNAFVKAELAMYKERISQYEFMEKELDDAIIQASEGFAPSHDAMGVLTTAPTSSKRRVQ